MFRVLPNGGGVVTRSMFIASYVTRNGRTRWVIVRDAGENGYSVPSMAPGCHTYRARDLDVVVRYSAAHGTSYASRSGAMRALRRNHPWLS